MSDNLKNEIILVSKQADRLVINNNSEFEAVSEYMKQNKLAQKKVAELLDPNIGNLYAAHRAATKQKKELLDPLVKAHDKASKLSAEWLYKKEQEQLAEQKRLQELARIEAEKEAETFRNLGMDAEAELVRQDMPIIQIEKDVPKTGVSLRKDFDFEILDEKQIKDLYKMPNETMIRQLVRTMGFKAAEMIGGIRVFEKIGTSTRIK